MSVVTINKNFDKVYEACIHALNKLDVKEIHEDKKNKTILAITNSTFWSWGENIQINFEFKDPKNTVIEVISSSNAQLFAWGKNLQNEDFIIQTVNEYLNQ